MGFDVCILTSMWTWDSSGKLRIDNKKEYINDDGVKILRLQMKGIENYKFIKFKRFHGFLQALNDELPDILFIHGCQFLDIDKVVAYLKKHPNVKVFVDNHADNVNSARNWFSKNIHKIIWRHCAHKIEPYTTKFYGVLPARVDFLKNIYRLPTEKCELLVMGADDELVEKAKTSGARQKIRGRYGIKDDDFLIITGGKIDHWKTQTLLLMQAVQNIKNEKLRLIVFGSVTQELVEQVKALVDGTKVQYVGWVLPHNLYDYFESADLVVFPGAHSVLWEQVVGQGGERLG